MSNLMQKSTCYKAAKIILFFVLYTPGILFAGMGQFIGEYWANTQGIAEQEAYNACQNKIRPILDRGYAEGILHPNQSSHTSSSSFYAYPGYSGMVYRDKICGWQFSTGGWKWVFTRAVWSQSGSNGECGGFEDPTGQCYKLPKLNPDPPSSCSSETKRGNPVDLMTGEKVETVVDFQHASNDLLNFKRVYNSKKGKWSFPYSIYTRVDNINTVYTPSKVSYTYTYPNLTLEFDIYNGNDIIKLTDNDSRTMAFYKNGGDSTFLPITQGVSGTLKKEIFEENGQSITQYVYTDGIDITIYDGLGKIKSIKRQDKTLNVNYDSVTDTTTYSDNQGNGFSLSPINANGDDFQLVDSEGNSIQYEFTNGALTRVTYPDGTYQTYIYDNPNNATWLTGRIDELGIRFATWDYDLAGRAILSTHANNYEKLNFSYDAVNYKVTETNPLGKQTVYWYYPPADANGFNKVKKIQGISSSNCLASDSYYSYDINGYRKTVTDKNGNVIETIRNSRGLVTEKKSGLRLAGGIVEANNPNADLDETAESQKTVTTWHATLALPLERTYYGWNGSVYVPYKKEETTYTTENRILTFTVTDLTAITVPYATNGRTHVWTYSYTYYDAAKTQLQQQTVNGPRTDVNDITTYNYDALGNLSSTVNALSHATTFTGYNVRGQVGNITDANNNVTAMTYTARGWLDILTVNGTAVTDYDYYANGLLQKVTSPDGSWLTYTYNDARHLTKIENNLGESINYTPSILDGKWTQEIVKDASATIIRQRQRVFDELGRVMTLQGQSGQAVQYGYDANDNLKTENDALQQVTSYQYDAQNRISETLDAEQNAKVDVNDQHPIVYGYDVQGNINSVTDQRGNATSYLYDGFGELIQQTSPDTGITTFTYDANGNLTGKTDARGINVAYQYDVLDRLKDTLHIGNPSEDISYSYDSTANGNQGIGRLTGYVDTNGTTTLTYDSWGMHESILCVANLQCYGTQYIHNSTGQLTSLVYPKGNSVIYGYDGLGRVNVVSYQQAGELLAVIASAIEYYPFGSMKKITYANGVVMNIGNDTDGRINAMTASGINPLYSKTYGHTVTDNISSIADLENSLNTRTYTYDKLSRLTAASKGAVDPITTSYSYDEVGNRLTKKVADSNNTLSVDEALNYPATSNRLDYAADAISGITKSYTYDATGNVTLESKNAGNNVTYTYSNGNRMSVSNVSNGSMVSYTYNALGQRIVKIPNGDFSEATYYHFGSAGQLLAEHHLESSTMLVENIYVNGILLAQMDARDGDLDDDGWTDSQEQASGTDKYDSTSIPMDADNDNVSDVADNCPSISNSQQQDLDNDSIGDACDGDLDGDAVANSTDNCPIVSNADQLDTDVDLIGDACDADDDNDGDLDSADNCPLLANADQLDTDGDQVGDLCDADIDNDGLINLADNCPDHSNLDQLDTDGDLQGNACDTDDDNDGDLDAADNCPLIANADQLDTDGDLQGNACDTDDDNDGLQDQSDIYPLVAIGNWPDTDNDGAPDECQSQCQTLGMGADADDDNDSVLDVADNCRTTVNADQLNTDGDLSGNACDTDDDNDLVSDVIELANGLDATNPWDTVIDNDGDGYTLGQELVEGSDPASLLSIPANEEYVVNLAAAPAAPANDVEFSSTWLRVANGFLELLGSASNKSVGLRFSLPINKSAEIISATLNPRTYTGSAPVTVTLALENSSNATQFTTPSYSRTYLANTVGWSFTSPYPDHTALQSPNLASLLSQVVNASTWTQGNHVFFKLTPLASGGYIRFKAYEGNPTFAVKLNIQVRRTKWDSDADTVRNSGDNCPFISNASQLNTDGDSRGDACDAFPNDPTKI